MDKKLTCCRLCQKADTLVEVLDLGLQPPSDEFRKKEDIDKPIDLYPLVLCLCTECGLHQLSYVVSKEKLYQNDYPYETGGNSEGVVHYSSLAKEVFDYLKLDDKSLVCDIGSNDGTLLQAFKNLGTKVIGVDPSNLAKVANERGISTYQEFFTESLAAKIKITYGEANLITATNCFAHVDDLYEFMKSVDVLLADDGVFIIESPTMLELIKNNAYGGIYFEHLSYLSLKPIITFMNKIGFEVFDVKKQEIHEGSLRMSICRKGKRLVEMSVFSFLKEEHDYRLHDLETAQNFAIVSRSHIEALRAMLIDIVKKYGTIAALSMPAKFQTVLNYGNIGTGLIDFATDRGVKVGRLSPGQNIEVFEDSELLKRNPDFAIIGAWNWEKNLIERNKEYKGRFISIFPDIRIL